MATDYRPDAETGYAYDGSSFFYGVGGAWMHQDWDNNISKSTQRQWSGEMILRRFARRRALPADAVFTKENRIYGFSASGEPDKPPSVRHMDTKHTRHNTASARYSGTLMSIWGIPPPHSTNHPTLLAITPFAHPPPLNPTPIPHHVHCDNRTHNTTTPPLPNNPHCSNT